MFLSEDVQKTLRSMKKISNEEILLKEGDLFVAVNVVTQQRRIVEIDETMIKKLSDHKLKDGKQILLG